ncbi:hypothetical protein Syun_023808 [Stephania yunnanensis]|uniref:sucrose synthase n=1 Tax=Stephania yunnanensis TaxID=152371 RepID=A0AAP0FDC8_9MAGN
MPNTQLALAGLALARLTPSRSLNKLKSSQHRLALACTRLSSPSSSLEGPKSLSKGNWSAPCRADFEPFNATFPRPTRSSSIGNGVQFLNRHLSSIIFRNKDCLEPFLDFLRAHKHKGHVMMVNDRIYNISRLQFALVKAKEFVSRLQPDTPYSEFEHKGVIKCNLSAFSFCEVLLEKEVDDDEDKE